MTLSDVTKNSKLNYIKCRLITNRNGNYSVKISKEKNIYNAFQFTNCAKYHKNTCTYSSSHQLIILFHDGKKIKKVFFLKKKITSIEQPYNHS